MKHKLKIELVYWLNNRGSYDGYTSLNGQRFRFFNITVESALQKLKDDVEFLCGEVTKYKGMVGIVR